MGAAQDLWDAQLASSVAGFWPVNATSPGSYEASRVVKASPGLLFGYSGYNSKASDQFIQLINATSLPADGAVQLGPLLLAKASSAFWFDAGTWGRYFTLGIVICNSSTGPTKTIGGADCWFDVQFA